MADRMAMFTDSVEEAPEREVATDLAVRVAIVAPIVLAVSAAFWGFAGLWSAAIALALVAANFLLGAAIITGAARISPSMLMGAVLGGFILRLGLISVIVIPIRHAGWFAVVPFAISLLVTHLGLLLWETQHVAASLAHPGLKPGHAILSHSTPNAERSE